MIERVKRLFGSGESSARPDYVDLEKARKSDPELLDAVSGILYRADPMGVRLEANTDEYDAEAATIIGRLPTATSDEDAARIVREELQRWFPDAAPTDEPRYDEIGRKIWSAWRSRATSGSR